MTPKYGFLLFTTASMFLISCTGKSLPPALPDERMQQIPTTQWPFEETPHFDPVPILPTPIVRAPLPIESAPIEKPLPRTKRGKRNRVIRENPEQIIAQANDSALVGPSKQAYLKNSVIIRYPYDQDKVYEVYTAPHSATIIRLPVGQRVASPVALKTTGTDEHPPEWAYGEFETGETKETHQDAYSIRPLKPGLDVYISFITLAGYSFHCRLRSFEKTSMREVTWAMPHVLPESLETPPMVPSAQTQPQSNIPLPFPTTTVGYQPDAPKPAQQQRAPLGPPLMALDRIHQGYTITVIGKNTPPWVPVGVLDDGSKTIITFKESLTFTNAPAPFAVHEDRTPAPVDFIPYTTADGHKLSFIIGGLHPELRLKGAGGLEVKITRIP
jgi:type IV secretory pathway VirB9-like protein